MSDHQDYMDRRRFAQALGLIAASGAAAAPALAQEQKAPMSGPMKMPASDPGKPKFTIGMIAFENMTHLDFVGPNDSLARINAAKVITLAKTTGPITTDTGTRVLPDMALKDAPDLDMIFIGGGPGSTALMEDPEVLAFLRERGPRAKYVTSVCTGALVLGAAGLLKGYRAATHWTAMDILLVLGATPVHERVVVDRNRITGGGVTAGIDFGLVVIAELWGADMAQMVQLGSEYNPKPPFNAGSPDTAPAPIVEHFKGMWSKQTNARLSAAQRMAARFA